MTIGRLQQGRLALTLDNSISKDTVISLLKVAEDAPASLKGIRLFNGQILTWIFACRNLKLGSITVNILLKRARLGFASSQGGIYSPYIASIEVTQRKDVFFNGSTNRNKKDKREDVARSRCFSSTKARR